MSLNSLPIDSSSCDYYDAISNTTSHPHINNCSSLRVRFRMVTHKSSQIQNKIQISSSSSLSHASLPRPPTNIPFTRGYIGPHSNAQPHVEYHETSFEEKTRVARGRVAIWEGWTQRIQLSSMSAASGTIWKKLPVEVIWIVTWQQQLQIRIPGTWPAGIAGSTRQCLISIVRWYVWLLILSGMEAPTIRLW